MKDTQFWGACDPSNEELLYVGKIQIVIRDWLTCVGRQISGCRPTDEDQHCDEYPSQFLHLYKKASAVHGVAVGEHLSRLAERIEASARTAIEQKQVKATLPRRVTQAPPPPPVLRGTGWIPAKPKPTEKPTDLPPDFPSSLRLKAEIQLGEAVREFPDRSKIEQLGRGIVLRMTPLFCNAVREGVLKAELAPIHMNDILHRVRVANCEDANQRVNAEKHVKNSEEWQAMLQELSDCGKPGSNRSRKSRPVTWREIQLIFISDERVQIIAGDSSETLNYGEFGFADGRNGKPNTAWETLRALAQTKGILSDPTGKMGWSNLEKRVQQIRVVFRKHFGLVTDPLPFVKDSGYQAAFRVTTAPSFDT